jgi:AcrR family transcriptional regulator
VEEAVAGDGPEPKDTWARVLDAAVHQFGAVPYARVSVASIAREAGTSQPNVYTYVGSKADLYAAALASVVERLMGRVSRAALEAEPREVVGAVHRTVFAEIRRSDLVALAFQDSDPDRFIALITEPIFQQVRLILESHLREGQRTGALRQDMDPAGTAAAAAAVIISTVVAWAHSGRPDGDPRGRPIVDLFRQAIAVGLEDGEVEAT